MFDEKNLKGDLAAMRLDPSGYVMIHSSMKSIGPVQGGADAVLNALMGYFEQGLVAMPALTWTLACEQAPVFDVLNTPGATGLLPELFRKRLGVVRSWHPTHSVAAYGPHAAAFTADDHLNDTPCGRTSSWHKLLERHAVILHIGCSLTSCTFLHGVEEWCGIEGRLGAPVRFKVIPPGGTPFIMDSRPHLGSPSEQFGKVEDILIVRGALRFGRIGDAKVYILDAAGAFDIVSECLARDPCLFDAPISNRS